MYSAIVEEHFMNPRNVGTIENADGIGEVRKCDLWRYHENLFEN